MRIIYTIKNDRYEKEGDLAREGFIHILDVNDAEYVELDDMKSWCAKLFGKDVKTDIFSKSALNETNTYYVRKYSAVVYLKNDTDAFYTYLMWA